MDQSAGHGDRETHQEQAVLPTEVRGEAVEDDPVGRADEEAQPGIGSPTGVPEEDHPDLAVPEVGQQAMKQVDVLPREEPVFERRVGGRPGNGRRQRPGRGRVHQGTRPPQGRAGPARRPTSRSRPRAPGDRRESPTCGHGGTTRARACEGQQADQPQRQPWIVNEVGLGANSDRRRPRNEVEQGTTAIAASEFPRASDTRKPGAVARPDVRSPAVNGTEPEGQEHHDDGIACRRPPTERAVRAGGPVTGRSRVR